MKTKMTFEVKGVQVNMEFEGSIKELMALNTSMVKGSKEWLGFFEEEGNRIFYLIDKAVDRSAETSKKVMLKEKEMRDFEKIIK